MGIPNELASYWMTSFSHDKKAAGFRDGDIPYPSLKCSHHALYVYIYMCVRVRIHAYTYMYVCVCICVCKYTHVYIYLSIYLFIYIFISPSSGQKFRQFDQTNYEIMMHEYV